jgi:hypothetical protein
MERKAVPVCQLCALQDPGSHTKRHIKFSELSFHRCECSDSTFQRERKNMGRRPNPLIQLYFDRGAKLDDASNRYEQKCKRCHETVSISSELWNTSCLNIYEN